MSEIDKILAERGERYGDFDTHANLSQSLKRAMRDHGGWPWLDDNMREALDMIQHKIARILNGDPHYADSWIDIAGYAKLVADGMSEVTASVRYVEADAGFLSSITLHGMGDDD